MRIVSLLPGATEIVYALGLGEQLAAVSHECDEPPSVAAKPRVTRSLIATEACSSAEIHRQVHARVSRGESLYALDDALLRAIQPDLILAQELCPVCAVSPREVEAAVAGLPKRPTILTLNPRSLEDVLHDILRVGEAAGIPERARVVVDGLRARIDFVRCAAAAARGRPATVLLEWLDPPMCGGHWNPELIELAGGRDPLGRPGTPARVIAWEAVAAAAPEVLVIAACGCDIPRTMAELHRLAEPGGPAALLRDLPATRKGFAYVADANRYFARPGPRLVDSLEILARLIHPEIFGPAEEPEMVQPWHPAPVRAPGPPSPALTPP